MNRTPNEIMDEAIAWTIRLRRAEEGDWEAFTAWLEADPAHPRAYDEVALADRVAGQIPERESAPAAVRVEPPAPRRPGRRTVLGLAVAAALAGVIGYDVFRGSPAAEPWAVETRPGEVRTLALEGGTEIHLNGGTRILLDRGDARFARLEVGEALFSVVTDPERPFRVEADDLRIQNIGTVFNVVHEDDLVTVEVAEGAVRLDAGGAVYRLSAGAAARHEGGRTVVEQRDPSTVGGWRQGQLSYSSASYAAVARDLSRAIERPVRASPAVADRRFTGVILVDPDERRLMRRTAALLEVEVRLAEDGWLLAPR